LRALFHLIEEKATVIISRFLPEAKNLPLQRRCEGICGLHRCGVQAAHATSSEGGLPVISAMVVKPN